LSAITLVSEIAKNAEVIRSTSNTANSVNNGIVFTEATEGW
jgi:hypothetical protein